MVAAFHDLHIGIQGGIIQGRGQLTHASAGLLDHFAGFVSAGALPTVGPRAFSQGIIGGKHIAGLEDGAVDLIGAKSNVVFAVFR